MIAKPMPTYAEIRRGLLKHQHVSVPFPMPAAQLEAAMQAWFRFLTLPMPFLLSLFRKDTLDWLDGRNLESGFRDPKREKGELHDNKFIFHYSDRTRMLFRDAALDFKESADFFDAADDVLHAAKQTFLRVLTEFEDVHAGSIAKVFPANGGETFITVRFLAYRDIKDSDVLARPHTDRGVATLHVAETNPRLLMGPAWEEMRPIDVHPGEAVFFGGHHIEWFVGNTEGFTAAKHEVRQEGPPLAAQFGRGSIVSFMDTLVPMPKLLDGVDTQKPA